MFVFGAIVYAALYGNVITYIANLGAADMRFREELTTLREFCSYNSVPPRLLKMLCNDAGTRVR